VIKSPTFQVISRKNSAVFFCVILYSFVERIGAFLSESSFFLRLGAFQEYVSVKCKTFKLYNPVAGVFPASTTAQGIPKTFRNCKQFFNTTISQIIFMYG